MSDLDGGSDCEKLWVRDGLFFLLQKGSESTSPWKTDTGENQGVGKI